MKLTIAFCQILVILYDVEANVNCDYQIGHAIKRKYIIRVGHILNGEPYQRLTRVMALDCLVNCEISLRCIHVNILEVKDGLEFQCDFYRAPTDLDHATITEMENSTLYSAISTGCTLLQRRIDGSVNFQRNWNDYKYGFGQVNQEYWLGLDNAHYLTRGGNVTLRFDLWYGEEYAFMEYYEATISDESDNYRLDYNGFSGNGSDSLTFRSKGMMFSTTERDNDISGYFDCSNEHGGSGGWWFGQCKTANLNGQYNTNTIQGIIWEGFQTSRVSLSKTEIRIFWGN